MTNKYEKHITEDRRLSILLLLADSTQYQANEELLRRLLGDVFGHQVGVDRLRSDLDWLEEQGLIHQPKTGGLRIAESTVRGNDVAGGRAVVTGVKRPRPGS